MQQRARLRGRLSAVAQTTDADRHQRSEVMIRTLYVEAAQTLTEFFEDARSGRRRPRLQSASSEGAGPYTLKQRMADSDHEQEYIK
jgi:hypothetical protein